MFLRKQRTTSKFTVIYYPGIYVIWWVYLHVHKNFIIEAVYLIVIKKIYKKCKNWNLQNCKIHTWIKIKKNEINLKRPHTDMRRKVILKKLMVFRLFTTKEEDSKPDAIKFMCVLAFFNKIYSYLLSWYLCNMMSLFTCFVIVVLLWNGNTFSLFFCVQCTIRYHDIADIVNSVHDFLPARNFVYIVSFPFYIVDIADIVILTTMWQHRLHCPPFLYIVDIVDIMMLTTSWRHRLDRPLSCLHRWHRDVDNIATTSSTIVSIFLSTSLTLPTSWC